MGRLRAKKRYDKFQNSDDGRSFAEFLGIKVPVVERSMGRYRFISVEKGIWGDWKDTKVEAFRDYKERLNTARQRRELIKKIG